MPDPTLQYVDPSTITAPELAALVDSYAGLRKRKAELNKLVDEVASEAEQIKTLLIAALNAQGLSSLGGHIASVSLKSKTVPRVTDWPAVYAYVRGTGEFDLLHRRLNETAVRARWDSTVDIPGVEPTIVNDLSVSTAI